LPPGDELLLEQELANRIATAAKSNIFFI